MQTETARLVRPPLERAEPSRLRRIQAILGPGLITGAADDDPSSVGTYSIVGAQFGTSLLWTALLTWPLIASIQMVCARVGIVTGKGLACALGEKFPRPVVACFAVALLIANTITVGADLSAMADAIFSFGRPRWSWKKSAIQIRPRPRTDQGG